MALITLDSLLDCLDVRALRPGVWSAPQLQMDYRRVFGGQLLAQAVALATESAPGKSVKSLSVVFPREGHLDEPLEFELGTPHDGRSFATRTISAAQGGKVFFLATVSLHEPDPSGLEHHDAVPDVGTPQEAVETDLTMIPWSTRVVGGVDLADHAAGPADYAVWTRVEDRRLPDDLMTHQALLAYATDLTIIGTALRPHEGYSQADTMKTLHTAVTTHNVWFHRSFRIDDWCLVSQHSPVTADGRAFGSGHVHDSNGALVASFAQESMIRLLA